MKDRMLVVQVAGVALAVAALMALPPQVSAVPDEVRVCTSAEAGAVTGTSDCEHWNSGIFNDFLDNTDPSNNTVNTVQDDDPAQTGFFAMTSWLLADRSEFDGDDNEPQVSDVLVTAGVNKLNVDGDAQEGEWSVVGDFWDFFTDAMFVFKDGAEKGDSLGLFGYLLDGSATSGEYESMFVDSSGNTRDISHISLYVKEGEEFPPERVPEPGLLLLVGTGLLGLALVRRRWLRS